MNDAILYRGEAKVTIVVPTARVSKLRRDEVELSNRLRTNNANRWVGMESSRQAELAALGDFTLCLHDLFPGWLCPPQIIQAWN